MIVETIDLLPQLTVAAIPTASVTSTSTSTIPTTSSTSTLTTIAYTAKTTASDLDTIYIQQSLIDQLTTIDSALSTTSQYNSKKYIGIIFKSSQRYDYEILKISILKPSNQSMNTHCLYIPMNTLHLPLLRVK